MTHEETERMMQFILQQQAQFAANQQQHDERIAVLEANMADVARAHAEMGRTQAEMGRAQTHLSEVVASMLDAQKHTQDKLDAFIGVLERYIAEGRNGKAGGEGPV